MTKYIAVFDDKVVKEFNNKRDAIIYSERAHNNGFCVHITEVKRNA